MGQYFTRAELVARLRETGWWLLDHVPNDGELASTLKAYQRHFGHVETGMADNATERSLNSIRFCSHADCMPFTLAAKWPPGRIAICMVHALPGLDMAQTQAAFEWSAQQWMSVCGIDLVLTNNPKTADIVAQVGRIDGSAGTLAYSQLADDTRSQKQQMYDAGEAWVFAEAPQRFQIDAGRVVGHELGHAFGMPHIEAGNWLQPFYDVNIRGPRAGDIRWMQANYGPPKPQEPKGDPKTVLMIELDAAQVNQYLRQGYKLVRV